MREIKDMLEPGMDVGDLIPRIYRDFKFFYEKVLGYNEKGGLNKYKQEWFNLAYENARVMIKAPSGFAKTTVLGVAFSIWWCVTHKSEKVLLISRTISQSKDAMLLQIRDLIEENELLKKLLKPEERDAVWNQTNLRMKTGCSIINRPYAISIKGYRAHIIILDEIDSYEDPNIYFDYVVPRLIPGGKIIGISTPEDGTGTLMSMIELRDQDYGMYTFRTYTSIINYSDYNDLSDGESIWPENFTMEILLNERSLGKQKFYKNYMCDANTELEDSVFQAVDIAKCIELGKGMKYTAKREGGEIYIGCDYASSSSPTGDFDAYVVVEKIKDTAIIRFAETIKGGFLPVPEKVKKMEELFAKYNPVCFICDISTIGVEIIRQARNAGLPVQEQNFYPGERNKLIAHLIGLVSNHKIIMPKHPEDLQSIEFTNKLEYEMLKFVEEKNKVGKSYVSKSSHDDSVMGLAMAVKHIIILDEFDDFIGVSDGTNYVREETLALATQSEEKNVEQIDPSSQEGGFFIKIRK